ncbi:MAG: hypothetical protein ACLQQ4_16900 [Bacteroidia bacterium]
MKTLSKYSFVLILLSTLFSACSKYTFTPAPAITPPPTGYYDNVSIGTVYNNDLIVAGQFTSLFNSSYIAQWNGKIWQSLGSGLGSNQYYINASTDVTYPDIEIRALINYNSNLIVGGFFTSAGGQSANSIAAWNGSSWQNLNGGVAVSSPESYDPEVYALAVYNNNLIVAGYFQFAGGIASSSIAEWNGTTWDALVSGINTTSSSIYSTPDINTLVIYNGNLIAGGEFDSIGGHSINNLAQWNGTSWSAFGAKCNGLVGSLIVYNGNLIAEGSFDTIGGIPAKGIAEWNGTTWSALTTFYVSNNNYSYSINSPVIYNGTLYFNSKYDSVLNQWNGNGSFSYVTNCNDTKWRLYSNGLTAFLNPLCVYNGNLIVGGWFTSVNGVSTSDDLAQWNGSSWSAF